MAIIKTTHGNFFELDIWQRKQCPFQKSSIKHFIGFSPTEKVKVSYTGAEIKV